MKFNLLPIEGRTDGAGNLEVIAETVKDVSELFSRFFWRDDSHETLKLKVAALEAGTYTHLAKATDKRGWFHVRGTLGAEWVAPYLEELEKRTGYNGSVGTIDLMDANKALTHTHCIESCELFQGVINYSVYVTAEDWNNKTAAVNAVNYAAEQMGNDFGATPVQSEYIETGYGNYKKNPRFGRHYLPSPALANAALFNKMFAEWVRVQATDEQKRLLDLGMKYGLYSNNWVMTQGHQKCVDLGHGGFRITPNIDGPEGGYKFMSWKEFQAVALTP